MSIAEIPGWELAQLNDLAAAGDLYGLPPIVPAAIDQAESSGQGGAINTSGYGGYFGLGANTSYPGGSTTTALLESTTPAAFDAQAELAASEYASLLAKTGGDTAAAERAYQGGGNEGVNVFASLGVPPQLNPTASGGTTATLTSSHGGAIGAIASGIGAAATGGASLLPGVIGGAVSSTASGIASAVTSGVVKGLGPVLLEIVFVLAAGGLILLGLARLFPGVSRTVTSTVATASRAAAA